MNILPVPVTFSVTGTGTLLGDTVPEAIGGVATVIMQSTGSQGTAVITATANSLSQGSVEVTTSSLQKKIITTAEAASIIADGTDTTMVFAGIFDMGDNHQPDAVNSITFSVAGEGTLLNTTTKAATAGTATVVLRSTIQTGTATVTATSSQGGGLLQDSIDLVTAPSQVKILVTAAPSMIFADGSATSLITAGINNSLDSLVTSATNNIVFSISGEGTLLNTTSKQAEEGIATIRMQSTSTAGTATVTATADNLAQDSFAVITSSVAKVVDPPSNFILTPSRHEVTVSWDAGTGNVGYRVDKKIDGGQYAVIADSITITSIEDSGLNAGATYWYRIRSYDSESDYSDWVEDSCVTEGVQVIDKDTTIPEAGLTNELIVADISAGTFKQDCYIEVKDSTVTVTHEVLKGVANTAREVNAMTIDGSIIGGNFNNTVKLRLYYNEAALEDGMDENDLRIYVLNESRGEWDKVGGTPNPDEDYVEAEVEHFSVYCVMGEGSDALAIQDVANYPNPMTNETVFTFTLTRSASVKLDVYTVAGKLVKRYDAVAKDAGYNEIPAGSTWDGTDDSNEALASGLYLYKLTAVPDEVGAKTITATGKLVIVK